MSLVLQDASVWPVKVLHRLHAASAHERSGQALRLRRSLARHARAPTPRFVDQSLDALLQKLLHPLIDKTTADPDYGSNVGDRPSVSQE